MYQVLGLKFWIYVGAVVLASVYIFFTKGLPLVGLPGNLGTWENAMFIVDVLAGSLLLKFVWRKVWRIPLIGKYCVEKVFPDLNGEYEVTIKTNYPIKEKILNAATHIGEVFDPNLLTGGEEDLGEINLKGTIDQGWFSISIELSPVEKSDNTIKDSQTLVCTPIKGDGMRPPRLAYVFEQRNQRVKSMDESNFLGAAVLEAPSNRKGHLDGDYWTMRAWRKGMNTAGRIEFAPLNSMN